MQALSRFKSRLDSHPSQEQNVDLVTKSGMDNRSVGILGGGQLGRMLVEAASRLNVETVILDADNSPAKQINSVGTHVTGSFSKASDVRELASRCHILTMEIEHVDTRILEELERSPGSAADGENAVEVQPSWKTVRTIQDKYLQKVDLQERGVAVAESISIDVKHSEKHRPEVEAALQAAGDKFGYPFMLKSRTLAYDGRGNYVVRSAESVGNAAEALRDRPLYCEKWADFKIELAVMVIKQKNGNCLSYPTVETVHENNICKLVYAPARGISKSISDKARALAEKAVQGYEGAGVFGVEMFLLQDGETILVNEIAPRPHNSGHYTIETHAMSQYEGHLRAILGLPIPPAAVDFRTPDTNAIMVNILGGPDPNSHVEACRLALETPGATLHLYGKAEARKGRKMGHVTVVAGSMAAAEHNIAPLVRATEYGAPSQQQLQHEASFSQPPPQYTAGTDFEVKQPSKFVPEGAPKVAVIMGSDSDLPTMKGAADILTQFGIPHIVDVNSAHRTAGKMIKFAEEAEKKGIKVIIAGAGGAAHLPGMVASETVLPVIGVPVKGSTFDGQDSLLSIVQMPRGCPVATVGVNNSTNAGLLAVRILGCDNGEEGETMRRKMAEFQKNMSDEVYKKSEKLLEIGYEEYLKQMPAKK